MHNSHLQNIIFLCKRQEGKGHKLNIKLNGEKVSITGLSQDWQVQVSDVVHNDF